MLSQSDFIKKQLVFVFFNDGEKLAFSNDNIVVKKEDGSVKMQCSCYRIFLVFAVGNCCITNVLIEKSRKFGFSIALMKQSWRIYGHIGSALEGNTVLRKLQYTYDSPDLAKSIIKNKITNQYDCINGIRHKNELQKDALKLLAGYAERVNSCGSLANIMGLEGIASKCYFSNYFNNIVWVRREPRIKRDMINSVLDIGYTILFSFIESLLICYGFDLYCGVMHRNFYMRKSLVCDLVEPFRALIDKEVRKAVNLKQCREEDFIVVNNRFLLAWEKNSAYVGWLTAPLIENRGVIHAYVQDYYRAFMKGKPAEEFPSVYFGGEG